MSSAIFAWDMHDVLYAEEGPISSEKDGYGDFIAEVDLSSFRRLPFEDNIPFFLLKFKLNGVPVFADSAELFRQADIQVIPLILQWEPSRNLGVNFWFQVQAPTGDYDKRRLVNPEFAALLVRKLAADGRLHLATDWQDYAEQMWDVLDATAGIANRAGARGSVPRPDWRPQTHFETRGQKLGHGVWDLLYDRC